VVADALFLCCFPATPGSLAPPITFRCWLSVWSALSSRHPSRVYETWMEYQKSREARICSNSYPSFSENPICRFPASTPLWKRGAWQLDYPSWTL